MRPGLADMTTTRFLSGITAPVCGAAVAARLGPAASGRAMAQIGLLHDTDGIGFDDPVRQTVIHQHADDR